MKTMRGYSNQRGASLVEVLIVLIVSAIAFSAGAQQYSKYLDNITNKQAADHATLIAGAGSKYLKDNYAAVLASAGPTTPAVITVAMLKATGYLPTGISDKNSFGQDYSVLVVEPAPNQLQALIVTTGGLQISELDGRRIAQYMGAKGGFISSINPTVAIGSYGGWSMPLAPFSVSPGAGHIATALFVEDGAVVNDYLYRNAVPGHPELNRMNTAIDMNGKDVKSAGAVTTNTVDATGKITAVGQIKGGALKSDSRTEVGEYIDLQSEEVEGDPCEKTGLVSKTVKGLILSCQSGVWTAMRGGAYGGTFMTSSNDGGCAAPNPYTGGCSCPAGFDSGSDTGNITTATTIFQSAKCVVKTKTLYTYHIQRTIKIYLSPKKPTTVESSCWASPSGCFCPGGSVASASYATSSYYTSSGFGIVDNRVEYITYNCVTT